jgi:hypothetical protein
MEVEITEVSTVARRIPLYNLRWGAIFAGLAVGIAVHLVLTLLGMAAGFAALDAVDLTTDVVIPVTAAAWGTISMVVAALIGGYVAARSSGFRRTTDGVLHGIVAWGASMLLFAAIATSAMATIIGGMFTLVVPIWQNGATSATDEAAIASMWLFGAILLSLVVGIFGGAIGVRGARRLPRMSKPVAAAPSRQAPSAG